MSTCADVQAQLGCDGGCWLFQRIYLLWHSLCHKHRSCRPAGRCSAHKTVRKLHISLIAACPTCALPCIHDRASDSTLVPRPLSHCLHCSPLATAACAFLLLAQARCIPGCVEDAWGQFFYKQIVVNGLVLNLVDALVAVVKRRLNIYAPFEAPTVSTPILPS